MSAVIGYENKITGEGVTSTHFPPAEAGYPLDNLLQEVTSTKFKWTQAGDNLYYVTFIFPGQVNISYIAIANHTLANAISLQLSYDSDFKAIPGLEVPEGNTPIMFAFPPVTTDQILLRVEMASPPEMAVYYMGEELELPNGIKPDYTPPPYALEVKQYPASNNNGRLLGVAGIRKGYNFVIKQDMLTPAWVDSNWPPLMNSMASRPFFYAWDTVGHPEQVMFGWIDKGLAAPKYKNALYMQFSQKCRGENAY